MPIPADPLLQAAEYKRNLSGGQRSLLMAGIVLGHAVLIWGLLQVSVVRQALIATAPMMFSMVEPEPAPEPVPPPATKSLPKLAPPTSLLATESPAVSEFVVETPQPDAPPAEHDEFGVSTAVAPATLASKFIPASAIEYLVPPPLEYPRASRKLREVGRVIVRVYVDEGGSPRVTQIKRSSGFLRLDAAALDAVQKARFKPYVEQGIAVAGWALIPLDFDLTF